MIQINLLPQEFRKTTTGAPRIPYVPLAILAGVLFLLLTFFFYGDYLRVRSAHGRVQKEWSQENPLLATLKALETKIEVEMKGETVFLEKNVLNTDAMTRILLWASELLPPKGWLTELQAERKGEGCRLILKGVMLASRTQTGIEQIEAYCQELKTKLPAQTSVALTTAKESKGRGEGTAFVADFKWGVTQKP